MWLFALFLAVPLIEIALFIQIGGAIGLLWTLLIVVVTAIIGTALVRSQGARELGNLRNSLDRLEDPTGPLVHGAMILFSGALLLTPGFFTDAVGFALLVPAVRTAAFKFLKDRVKFQQFSVGGGMQHPQSPRDTVVDGEFSEINEGRQSSDVPSKWTKH